MPIYEYQCTHCGVRREHLQKMSDTPLTTCPACSAEAYVRQISAASFHLKGTGWYETDFKHSGSPTKAPSGESASTQSAGSGSTCDH